MDPERKIVSRNTVLSDTAPLTNRLDRPVDPTRDHVLGPQKAPDHARRVRQLRLPALPRGERANRRGPRPVRRALALRVPAPARHRQRHRAPRRGARRACDDSGAVLGRARRADDALEELTEEDLDSVARGPGGERARLRRGRGAGEGASRRRRRERARERRAVHADVLHQRPPLRRALGRELVRRRDARLARPPRSLGGARASRAGRRRPACCCCWRRSSRSC